MHRTIEASIPGSATDAIISDLLENPHVININTVRNGSVKPKGDTVMIHVLNRGADAVFKSINTHAKGLEFSIVTSEIASISDPKYQYEIDHDIDEAIWEEMETGLRHNGRLTQNYLILMAIGGIVSAVGFVSEIHDLVVAFIAASIIAPGLESVAKIPLGIALRKSDVFFAGLRAFLVGYACIILSAGISFWVMDQFGVVIPSDFTENKATHGFMHFETKHFLLSLAAACASIVMYLSYRRNVIAGPLIALVLIPATAAIGISLYLQKWDFVRDLSLRLAVDIALVIFAGIAVIRYKQKFVHKREPSR